MLYSCRELKTDDDWLRLRGPWNALLARCSLPSPFCTWEWAWEWWRHFGAESGPPCRLLAALAYSGSGELIGLAPFYFPAAPSGPLRLRPLRPLGTRLRCRVDDMTEEPILLLDRDHAGPALARIWEALRAWPGRAEWDLIHLRGMRRAGDPRLAGLWRRLPGTAPFLLTRASRRLGQTRRLPPSWPEFRASLSKSMRDNAAYYPRLLTRDGHEWAVRIARTPAEVAAATPALIRLHGRRAESERGPAHMDHLPGAAQKRFLGNVLVRLAGQGKAAVALLEVGGTAIAAQATLEAEGRLTFYYSGFDTDWHKYSPVTVLHLALLEDAIRRGVGGVDYLPGPEPWKTRWGVDAEWTLDEVSCLSVHPRALLRSAWRSVIRRQSRRRGLSCECGFCSLADQQAAPEAAQG